jgi:hypothetical protein
MRNRSTPVLLILFFLGLGALWLASRSGLQTASERERAAGLVLPTLAKVEPGEVKAVEIRVPGQSRVVLEREGERRWQVVEPGRVRADATAAEALVGNLKSLERYGDSGPIEVGANAATLGVDDRATTVVLLGEDRTKPLASVRLGAIVEDRQYVREEGAEAASVVDEAKLAPARQPAEDWRDRNLFDIFSYDVASIQVDGPGRSLAVELDGPKWRIRAPIPAAGDPVAIDRLLADLATLSAVGGEAGFAAVDVEDVAPFGLSPPRFTLSIRPLGATSPDDREPRVVEFGSSPPGRPDLLYARRGGEDDILAVPARTVATLGLDPNTLRSRKVFDLDPGNVAAIEIRRGEEVYRLARLDRGWASLSPSEGAADEPTVGQLLSVLGGLETAEFLAAGGPAEDGLGDPAATIRVWEAPQKGTSPTANGWPDREADATLKLGRFDAAVRGWHARLAGDDGTTLLLPATIGETLPDGPLAYLDRTVGLDDPDTIDRITLARGGQSMELTRDAEHKEWVLTAPLKALADPSVARGLALALGRLRAEKLIAAEASAEQLAGFGLAPPYQTLRWTAGPNTPERGLDLGGPAPKGNGSRYARLAGGGPVFLLPTSALAVLTADPRLRQLVSVPADRIVEIALDSPAGTRIVAARRPAGPVAPPLKPGPGNWRVEGENLGPADEARLDLLAETLAKLTATSYVQHAGPLPAGAGLTPPTYTIRAIVAGAEKPLVLRIGARTADNLVHAALGDRAEGEVFLVPAEPFSFALPLPTLPENLFAR